MEISEDPETTIKVKIPITTVIIELQLSDLILILIYNVTIVDKMDILVETALNRAQEGTINNIIQMLGMLTLLNMKITKIIITEMKNLMNMKKRKRKQKFTLLPLVLELLPTLL